MQQTISATIRLFGCRDLVSEAWPPMNAIGSPLRRFSLAARRHPTSCRSMAAHAHSCCLLLSSATDNSEQQASANPVLTWFTCKTAVRGRGRGTRPIAVVRDVSLFATLPTVHVLQALCALCMLPKPRCHLGGSWLNMPRALSCIRLPRRTTQCRSSVLAMRKRGPAAGLHVYHSNVLMYRLVLVATR